MTDVLIAIDEALDTGVAADDDPMTRELQELALMLRDDAPQAAPEFRERMDGRVESGFRKPRGSRRAWWQPLLRPAAAFAMTAAAVGVIAVAAGGLSGSDNDEGGGSRGALATNAGGGAAESDSGGGAATSAPEQSARSAGGADQSAATVLPPAGGGGFAPGRSNRKIERQIGLELEMPVDQMAHVADQVTAVTNRYGGFVLNSSVSTGEDGAGGDFDLRIPANRLRPAIRDLSALADVRTQSQTGRDVTREHVTAKDRLGAARAERRSLLRRLEVASTNEEAEALRRRLDLVAGEINGLRAQLRDLRLRTDYSVVVVTLLAKNGDNGSGAGGGSFDDALGDAGGLLVTVAGWIVRALAVALPLALLALAGWAVGGVVRRRRRESVLA